MLRRLPLLAVTLAVGLSGCGGGGDDDEPSPVIGPPETSIEELEVPLAGFLDALGKGDAEGACRLLTPKGQEEVGRELARLFEMQDGDCVDVLTLLLGRFERAPNADELISSLANRVRIGGEWIQWKVVGATKARAEIKYREGAFPARLVLVDEMWLVSSARRLLLGLVTNAGGPPMPPSLPSIDVPPEFEPGLEVAAQSGCSACHMFGESGGDLGPDLTEIGARLSREEIAAALKVGPGIMPSYEALEEDQPRRFADLLLFLASLDG